MFLNNHISIVIYMWSISALCSLLTIMTAQNIKQTANDCHCFSTQWMMHVTPLTAQIHGYKHDIDRRAMIANT